MIALYVLNYSTLGRTKTEGYINNFINRLKEEGIDIGIKIEYCEELFKNRFQKYIDDKKGNALVLNDNFLMEVNDCLLETSNNINIHKYKFVFIGEQLKTKNPWGDEIGYIAVIKKVKEKVIWHEIAHLLGAEEHYNDDATHTTSEICSDPSNCIMTYGKLEGEPCYKSLQEIRKALIDQSNLRLEA